MWKILRIILFSNEKKKLSFKKFSRETKIKQRYFIDLFWIWLAEKKKSRRPNKLEIKINCTLAVIEKGLYPKYYFNVPVKANSTCIAWSRKVIKVAFLFTIEAKNYTKSLMKVNFKKQKYLLHLKKGLKLTFSVTLDSMRIFWLRFSTFCALSEKRRQLHP